MREPTPLALVDEMRWWTLAELQQTQHHQVSDDPAGMDPANSHLVAFSPRPLVRLLEDLITGGRPVEPVRLDGL